MFAGLGNTTLASIPMITNNFNYRYGAVGNLLLNKTYRIYVECMKDRSASGATLTFDCIGNVANTIGNSIG